MVNSFNQLPPWLRLGIIFPIAFLNTWLLFLLIGYLEPLVSIFITATLFAFLLDIPIGFLRQKGVPKGAAIALVFLIALIILSVLGLVLIPLIVQQLTDLINVLPKWIESGVTQLQHLENLRQWAIAQNLHIDFNQIISQAADKVSAVLQSLSNQTLTFILVTIGSIVNIVVVLVFTVFLVITGQRLWDGLFSWLPAPWDLDLRELIREKFERYFASQAILAGILSIAQTLVLTFLQVPYAVLFGVTIGLTTLIPYGSLLTIIIITVLLCFQNLTLGLKVLIAAFIVGQINDQVIAPRLMGGLTGLNPVWLIIALFIGGKIGGILGLLIAVPLASVIKSTADTLRANHQQAVLTPIIGTDSTESTETLDKNAF